MKSSTVIPILAIVWWSMSALLSLGAIGALCWVAWHFLSKWW